MTDRKVIIPIATIFITIMFLFGVFAITAPHGVTVGVDAQRSESNYANCEIVRVGLYSEGWIKWDDTDGWTATKNVAIGTNITQSLVRITVDMQWIDDYTDDTRVSLNITAPNEDVYDMYFGSGVWVSSDGNLRTLDFESGTFFKNGEAHGSYLILDQEGIWTVSAKFEIFTIY